MKVKQMSRNGNEVVIIVEQSSGIEKTFRLFNASLVAQHLAWEAKAIQIEDEFGEMLKQAEVWKVAEAEKHVATGRSIAESAKVIILHAEQAAAEAMEKALA